LSDARTQTQSPTASFTVVVTSPATSSAVVATAAETSPETVCDASKLYLEFDKSQASHIPPEGLNLRIGDAAVTL